jgi:hypothetical protein
VGREEIQKRMWSLIEERPVILTPKRQAKTKAKTNKNL